MHGENGCEWVDAGWKLVRGGGSGLRMSGSGWDRMGVGGVGRSIV